MLLSKEKLDYRRKLAMALLVILFISLIPYFLDLSYGTTNGPMKEESFRRTNVSFAYAYTPHATMDIVGDDALNNTAQIEGWSGNGTETNPFIIENLQIDGEDFDDHCVQFRHTRLYFIIRNCFIGNTTMACLRMFNVSNVIVVNTIFENGNNGIQQLTCENILIMNNTCLQNQRGINIRGGSTNIDIINNTCTSNGDGIWIWENSDYNNVINNTCSWNNNGIYVEDISSNTQLIGNICTNNTQNGLWTENANYQNIVDNVCNDNGVDGLVVENSYETNITENTCSGNGNNGIYVLRYADMVLVSNNTCNSNSDNGIAIDNQCNNTILSSNNCTDNTEDGIYVKSSQNIEITDNELMENDAGVHLYLCSAITIFLNNITNSNIGIHISNSEPSHIFNNTILDNFRGIYIYNCNESIIEWNWITNGMYGNVGIDILQISSNHTLTNNTITGFDDGIILGPSVTLCVITWNAFEAVWSDGLDDGTNNFLSYNYYGSYPDYDADGNGIGDEPFYLSGTANNTDATPLMLPPGSPISWLEEPQNQVWYPGVPTSYDLNASAMPPGLDHWWINNSVQFSISSIGIVTNITILDDGDYTLQVWVWDTLGTALHTQFTIRVLSTEPTTSTSTTSSQVSETTLTTSSTSQTHSVSTTITTTTTTTTTTPIIEPPDYTLLILIAIGGVVVIIVIVILLRRKS